MVGQQCGHDQFYTAHIWSSTTRAHQSSGRSNSKQYQVFSENAEHESYGRSPHILGEDPRASHTACEEPGSVASEQYKYNRRHTKPSCLWLMLHADLPSKEFFWGGFGGRYGAVQRAGHVNCGHADCAKTCYDGRININSTFRLQMVSE